MGKGSDRNKICKCGSGKKRKYCDCKLNRIQEYNKLIKNGQGMFHTLGIITEEDYPGFEDLDDEKCWYAPLCNLQQIERIFNPKNGNDILLKKQVDSVIDNMRVNRVFYSRYNISKDWDIERQFDSSIFDIFRLSLVGTNEYEMCKTLPSGMTYDSDANGQCIKTQYGNIITISAVLKQFLYYMNIFYYGVLEEKIPDNVITDAVVLGIRIMLQTEALDFEIDPRGEVPRDIDDLVSAYTTNCMLFVVAHEFAHSLLGHLDDNNVIYSHEGNTIIYNQSQKQEFEADIKAIQLLGNLLGYSDAIGAAIKFFMSLDLYEQAKEQIFPSIKTYKTHPKAEERIRNISDHYQAESKQYNIKKLIDINKILKNELMEKISLDMEAFENYGSVYLEEWHKTMLRDRIDY